MVELRPKAKAFYHRGTEKRDRSETHAVLGSPGVQWDTRGGGSTKIADIADIARNRRDRKINTSPLRNTDDTDQESGAGNQLDFGQQEEEGCAVADGAFHPDRAAVIENNML